jgi:hypothetical protein
LDTAAAPANSPGLAIVLVVVLLLSLLLS